MKKRFGILSLMMLLSCSVNVQVFAQQPQPAPLPPVPATTPAQPAVPPTTAAVPVAPGAPAPAAAAQPVAQAAGVPAAAQTPVAGQVPPAAAIAPAPAVPATPVVPAPLAMPAASASPAPAPIAQTPAAVPAAPVPVTPAIPVQQTPAVPAAPPAPVAVVGIRPALSKEDLDKLAVEDKNKSDTLLIEGLRKIANAPYGLLEFDNKKFLNAYEAYMYLIKKILVDDVGNNDIFKLRQQLLDLVGQKDQLGGTLQKFAADKLQIKGSESEFLADLYKNIDILLGQFADLFKACFFYEKTFIDQAALYVEYIFANIVNSQRTAVQPNDPGKKTSNDFAVGLMKEFEAAVQGEITAQTKKAGANGTAVNLSKDYIIWLGDRINRLRANPGFYRFNGLIPLLDKFACAKNCMSLDAKNKVKSSLLSDALYKELSEQLFYDANLLATVLPKSSAVLDVAIADHNRRVAKD